MSKIPNKLRELEKVFKINLDNLWKSNRRQAEWELGFISRELKKIKEKPTKEINKVIKIYQKILKK